MARVGKPLSDTEVKKDKPRDKNYKIYDVRGLFLIYLFKPPTIRAFLWRTCPSNDGHCNSDFFTVSC